MCLPKLMLNRVAKATFGITAFFLLLLGCKKSDPIIPKTDTKMPIEEIEVVQSIEIDSLDPVKTVQFEKSYIFKFGFQGYQYAYSDLLVLENGTFLLACNREKQITDFTPFSLVLSSSADSGNTWSAPKEVTLNITEKYLNVLGPSLVNIGKGRVLLFFGVKFGTERIDIYMKESLDYGKSWTPEKIVYAPNQGYQTLNNNRVSYINGRLFVPLAIPNNPKDLFGSIGNNMSCFYYYSDDVGKSWKKSMMLSLKDTALLEPDVVRLSDNEMLMNFRLNLGRILFARTKDRGKTWKFEYSKVKSPSSPQKIISLDSSNALVMVWNNTDRNFNHHGGNRGPLTLAVSFNKGYTWKIIANLEDAQGYDYSYPSLTQDSKNLYITYFELYSGKIGYGIKMIKIKKSQIL